MRGVRRAVTSIATGLALGSLAVGSVALPAAAAEVPPPLVVVGATGNALPIASSGPTLATGITIATGTAPAASVVSTLTPLQDSATGERYPVEQPRTELGDLPANTTAMVPVAASLPYTGTFTATLSLAHDGTTDPPIAITVTRSLAPGGVTADAVQATSSSFDGRGAPISVTRVLVLNETAGRPTVLSTPVLVKPSSQTGTTMLGESSAQVTATEVAPAQVGCGSDEKTIQIEAGRSCRIEVTLALPRVTGQHDGTLRFTQPGSPPLDSPVTVQLRRGVLSASVAILLGLGLGLFVNVILRRRRTRLDRLDLVARAGQELDRMAASLPGGLVDDAERRTHTGLRARLADLAAAAADDTKAAGRLTVVRAQVAAFPAWVSVRRAILAAPPSVSELLQPAAAALAERLASDSITEEDAATLAADLESLVTRLAKAQAGLVAGEIEALRDYLAGWFDASARAPIEAQLDRAAQFVTGDDVAPQLASRELAIAERMAAVAMRERLEGVLDVQTPSFGMDPASWSAMAQEARTTMAGIPTAEPADALESIREADRMIVGTIARAASAEVGKRLAPLGGVLSDREKERKAALVEVQDHLRATTANLAKGDLAAAHASLAEAQAAIERNEGSGFMDAAGQPESLPQMMPAPGAAATTVVAPPDLGGIVLPDLRDVRAAVRRYEWSLLAATFVVGLAIGLLALYVGKPTWGSLGDVMLAVLWGAGLSQVDGALQQGFPGVRTALTAPTS